MNKSKVGLLPLYLELYDRTLSEYRVSAEKFLKTIIKHLQNRGIEVVAAPICRLKKEFAGAVKSFEETPVDAIVTLHLAYSPSLESAGILAATKIPIIVLDTTPDFDFGPGQSPEAIMSNHGIHGVQDMCNLLVRNRKRFFLESGHWEKSDVLDRVAGWAYSARLILRIRQSRVGQIGSYFEGMGDFALSPGDLRVSPGIETVIADPGVLQSLMPADDDPEVDAEVSADRKKFNVKGVGPEVLRKANVAGLAVRRWINKEKLSAFTFNFLTAEKEFRFPILPFLEAAKSMARGIGYAGEGDVLTAALVGTLITVYPETSFVEMFCPDWKHNTIFLSHMGEMNLNLVSGRPRLIKKDFPFTKNKVQLKMAGRFKPGSAVLVNLAPGPERSYTLLVAPVQVLPVKGKDRMTETVHGWIKPSKDIAEFLSDYSYHGGTHHLAMVYGKVSEEIIKFGRLMGWKTVRI
ncbi:MAG: hypothetical protein V2A65_09990 [Candidatus Omnitrophota bacterium]